MNKKINKIILEIINKALKIKTKIKDTNVKLSEIPQWDSLSNVRIIMEIEKTFKIKFNLSEIEELKTIDDLVKKILSK